MSAPEIERLFESVRVRRTGDVLAAGVSEHYLKQAVATGLVKRPVMRRSLGPIPGILVSPDTAGDLNRDAAIAMLLTGHRGVVWGQTAAKRHGLADGMGGDIHLLVPHGYAHMPRQALFVVRRTRNADMLGVGVTEVETDLGVPVRMTGPARTVVDLFASGRSDQDDYRTALTALVRFGQAGGEAGELLRIADRLHPAGRVSEAIDKAANMYHETASAGSVRRMGMR